jgi:hypothetical protein
MRKYKLPRLGKKHQKIQQNTAFPRGAALCGKAQGSFQEKSRHVQGMGYA